MENKTKHIPVLLQETIGNLELKSGDCFIDATLGGGGHFFALLTNLKGNGSAIGIDEDKRAIIRVKEKLINEGFKVMSTEDKKNILSKNGIKITLLNENFINLDKEKKLINENPIKVIIADLGLSTDQIEDEKLGFSYQNDYADLDMRLNTDTQVKAKDLLNGLYKKELEKMFFELGDISFTKILVREILKTREKTPFQTVGQLKNIIQRIVPFYSRRGTNRHPEAKVFQAIRIAVNQELHNLQCFLPLAFETLASGGRIGVISFHSGEDRIVKNYFRDLVEKDDAKYINDERYYIAKQEELFTNKKSHSAKLRIVTKN